MDRVRVAVAIMTGLCCADYRLCRKESEIVNGCIGGFKLVMVPMAEEAGRSAAIR